MHYIKHHWCRYSMKFLYPNKTTFERGVWNSLTNYSKSGVLSRSLLKVWHHSLYMKKWYDKTFFCESFWNVMHVFKSITFFIMGFDLIWKKFEWGCLNKEILSSPPFRVDVLVVKLMKVLIFKRSKSTKHFHCEMFSTLYMNVEY